MLSEYPETRSQACWQRTATVPEMVELLEDDSEWRFGGNPNFDGDATTTICVVSESAVHALADVAPLAAPPERIAAAVLRLHDRVTEIQTCTWADPYKIRKRWKSRELAPFGEPLVEVLRAKLNDDDLEVRRRAKEVLADLSAPSDER